MLGSAPSPRAPAERAQLLCESRGGRPGLPVPNRAYGLCGRKFRAQELCESRGGRPWAPVPNKPTVSVDVKQHSTNFNVGVKQHSTNFNVGVKQHLKRKKGSRRKRGRGWGGVGVGAQTADIIIECRPGVGG